MGRITFSHAQDINITDNFFKLRLVCCTKKGFAKVQQNYFSNWIDKVFQLHHQNIDTTKLEYIIRTESIEHLNYDNVLSMYLFPCT